MDTENRKNNLSKIAGAAQPALYEEQKLFVYRTRGTCSTQIRIELDGDIVKAVQFTGGCSGNLKGISAIVSGMHVDDVIRTFSGITCGMKPTSCPDQLAKALIQAKALQN